MTSNIFLGLLIGLSFVWLHYLYSLKMQCFLVYQDKKLKVKCTLVQALKLCTGRSVYTGSRGIALVFLDRGTRRGRGVSVTPRPLFTPGKDAVPILQEAEISKGTGKCTELL